jgi:hypothetical protein
MPIQNLPPFFNMVYTNKDDGRLSPDGYLYNDQMFQALNAAIILLNDITTTIISRGSVTLNGLNPPSLTTEQIMTLITSNPVTVPMGTIWYNSDIDKLQYLGSGNVLHTITSTP